MPLEIGLYLLLGAVAGILAGLLGVGGGLIIVPILVGIFTYQGIIAHDIIIHMALGTSLASILFTSVSSVISHHKHAAVSWAKTLKLTPGIMLGAWLGGLSVSHLSQDILKPLFAFFECLVAITMLSQLKPNAHNNTPSLLNYTGSGAIIGFISSLVGIGGGSMSVPWLLWHGSSIHRAIATSAAIGFPIALGATAGYLISGWQHSLLPAHSLGFIYLPAFFSIIVSSMLLAPLGARLAHSLEVEKLKQLFAFLLIALGIYLFIS